MSPRVAVIGASGFVGRAVVQALSARGAEVVSVAAPRLRTEARDADSLVAQARALTGSVDAVDLAARLSGCTAVVNAAGLAQATGTGDDLFGANALLPALVALVSPVHARVVHVSSAAVQGRRAVLDESVEVEPFSPYSSAKALGEQAVRVARRDAVVYRPTSVQGAGRAVTASLVRLFRSPFSSVAAGAGPTPQVLVGNVGDAVAFLATCVEEPPAVVLHPWEGMTTHDLARVLGGRRPVVVPRWFARTAVACGQVIGRASGAVAGTVRRVEMLWLGQQQAESWLDGRWSPVEGRESWRNLG